MVSERGHKTETSEQELGGDTPPLFYTVAVIAVGCGDSLDLSMAHINVHLVMHVTKTRTI